VEVAVNQRLDDENGSKHVLHAGRGVRAQQRRALPLDDVQLAAGAALLVLGAVLRTVVLQLTAALGRAGGRGRILGAHRLVGEERRQRGAKPERRSPKRERAAIDPALLKRLIQRAGRSIDRKSVV